jgi:hypothetical protein
MFDLFFFGSTENDWKQLKAKYPLAKRASSLSDAKCKCFTKFFWAVFDDLEICEDFDFSYKPDNCSQTVVHVFLNNNNYDGIALIPKNSLPTEKEFTYRFYAQKKEVDIRASTPKPYDVFEIETYIEYEYALENSTTEMFWMSSPNIKVNEELIDTFYFSHHNTEDRSQNHAFVHEVDGEKHYNGLFLCSKKQPLTKREVEYRFPVNRREWDLIGSTKIQYPKLSINTYDEYKEACETVSSELFWAIPDDVDVVDTFDFDWYFTHDNEYDRYINHSFLNGKYNDGILLCSKNAKISKKEFDYGFVINKKEHDIQASIPKPFDIVFMSYDESNAEVNFEKLKQSHPNAKRVHGVKGIHNAHIKAARQVDTEMFWVVDADAEIVDGFHFDYQVPKWERDTVHVCRSQNPVNGLIYGYGGVKLLPTDMTINMDTSKPDMTTSISNKFKPIEEISNITAFNTDPFSAWKSAFRECAKLASKTIDRQKDEETKKRLDTWCNVGVNAEYGVYAIKGAIQGRQFGKENKENPKVLAKINDFDWLKEQYNELAG